MGTRFGYVREYINSNRDIQRICARLRAANVAPNMQDLLMPARPNFLVNTAVF